MDNNQNRNTNRNNPNMRGNDDQRKNKIITIIIAVVGAIIFTSLGSMMINSATKQEITYDQFIMLLDNNQVESVVFDSGKIYIEPKT